MPTSKYARRRDLLNQSWYSICTECAEPVAVANTEAELADGEELHRCNPTRLKEIETVRKQAVNARNAIKP